MEFGSTKATLILLMCLENLLAKLAQLLEARPAKNPCLLAQRIHHAAIDWSEFRASLNYRHSWKTSHGRLLHATN